MSSLTNFQKVNNFNVSFGIGRSSTPDDKLFKLRWDLIQEETDELFEAISKKDYVEIIDAVSDILYVVHGAADSFEQDFDTYLKKDTLNSNTDVVELADKIRNMTFGKERMELIFTEEKDKLNNLINDYSSNVKNLKQTFESKNIIDIMLQLVIVHNYLYKWADLFGFDLDETFNLVHDSNMSKLAETEEVAQKTVEWYKEHEKRYDSPAYRLSTVKVNNENRWVIYNENSGKALKSINYKAVDLKTYLYKQ
jgi:predicted HAD superfamily Cof-like phosphohydrolase